MTKPKAGPQGLATAPPDMDALLSAYLQPGAVQRGPLSEKQSALLRQLIERYRAAHGEVVLAKVPLEAFLAELRQFDRDPIALLRGVELALDAGVPVPKFLADNMQNAIGMYLGERAKTMDAALQLAAAGKANPRRAARESAFQRAALGRMMFLHSVGANIEQAAVLVSRLAPDLAVSTLIDRYKRSGYGATAKAIRAHLPNMRELESTLAEYPDGPLEVRQAKTAIRAMYAKRKPSRT